MQFIKVELHIDPSNVDHVEALSRLMTTIGGNTPTETVKVPQEAPKQPKAAPKAKAEKLKVVKTEKPTAQDKAANEAAAPDEPEVSLQDIRLKVSVLKTDHRDAIRGELDRIEVAGITKLKQEQYAGFMAFLLQIEEDNKAF